MKSNDRVPIWLAFLAYLAYLRVTQPASRETERILRWLIIIVGMVLIVIAVAVFAPEHVGDIKWPTSLW